jgi:hypothetical protein
MQVSGARTIKLLVRVSAVAKSATAAKGQRPTPEVQYDSLAIDAHHPLLADHQPLVIVDDCRDARRDTDRGLRSAA